MEMRGLYGVMVQALARSDAGVAQGGGVQELYSMELSWVS